MHRSGLTLTFAAAVLVAGCADVPHNNVLLFGTDTKVALDISSAATQGGAPQITLGYRRSEAVWMPLVANDRTCDNNGENCKITTAKETTGSGNAAVTKPVLLEGKRTVDDGNEEVVSSDSYSVFASFGAKFSGGASGTEAKASGGLAQLFATGIAAQKLAANPGVENALRINSPGAAEGEAKKAEADARLAATELELGKQRAAELDALAAKRRKVENAEATLILDRCGGPETNKTKWDNMLNAAVAPAVGLPAAGAFVLGALTTNDEAHNKLELNNHYRKPIFDKLSTLC